MSRTFRVAATFHPGYSLLGRLCRQWAGGAWRGETWYLAALTGLALALLLAQMLAWSVLGGPVTAAPTGPLALRFFAAQAASVTLLAAACLAGRRPAVTLTCDDATGALRCRQGRRHRTIPYATLRAAEPLADVRFHRVERRRPDVAVFRGRFAGSLARLRLAGGACVVVGLATPADRDALCTHLRARLDDAPDAQSTPDERPAPAEALVRADAAASRS